MENKLHFEVLPKRQRELFESLSKAKWISDFYLAGGTALALQIAHRRSIDFDFFTKKEFDMQLLKKRLVNLGDFKLFSESEGTINGELNSIKISFFNLPYSPIGSEKNYRSLRIISEEDIAAMKLAALSSRGSKKDFVDLYFLLKDFSLSKMIGFFEKKYEKSAENVYCALKGVIYFVDADEQPMPRMLKRVTWREVKKSVKLAHKKYITELSSQK